MNFFEEQARAKTRSRSMVFAFLLSVVLLVLVIDVATLFALGIFNPELTPEERPDPLTVVLFTSTVVIAVIGFSSLYRMATLAGGGAAVAIGMGAAQVREDTLDPKLRRLRNVVEEMAIASGTPVPQVFVLEFEPGINAFASGYAPADAAVTVTRGALDKLTRDELQGVIAHEFSHVLNGDMRLNIRLMGLLFGLLVLGVIGRKVLEHGPRGRDSGKGAGAVFVIAFAVMAVGYIGLFCGRIIKAGVSRQREYLADAAAVQFTRQTLGLAGALKKAAGLREGTRLVSADREEVAHMLFGDGVGYSLVFATHPPLADRIRKLDPAFKPAQLSALAAQLNSLDYFPDDLDRGLVSAFAAAQADPMPARQAQDAASGPGLSLKPADVVAHIGHPNDQDYAHAHSLIEHLPAPWRHCVYEPARAGDVVLALLLSQEPVVRLRQIERCEQDWGRARVDTLCELAEARSALHRAQQLPLIALALPALRRRPAEDLRKLIQTADFMIHADGRVEVFEYALGRVLQADLSGVLSPATASRQGTLKLDQAQSAIVDLLCVLAQHGNPDAAVAQRAFIAGLRTVLPTLAARYQPPADWTVALDRALPQLDRLVPQAKAGLVESIAAVLSADGRITIAEAELLRAVCAALQVPVPAVLAPAT